MKINLIKRYFLFLTLIASFAMVPVACSSDDGDPEPPEVIEDATPDPTNSNTTIEATSPVTADGTATSTVTVTIADTDGEPVTASAGVVALSSTGSATVSEVTDNGNGTYTATVTDTVAESVTISGTLADVAITDTAMIDFEAAEEAATPDPANSNTTIEASEVTDEDGTLTSTVTVQLADTNGELLTTSGGTVVLTTDGEATISEVTDNGDGTYTATVTSTIEENVTVSGTLDGAAINNTGIITFNPDDSNPAQEADQTAEGEEAGPSQILINCGGEEVTFGDVTFLADQYFSDNTSAFTNPFLTEIEGTEMDSIYLTERVTADASDNIRGPFSYNIPVENGTYTVRLYFAEIYWGVENPQGFEGDVGQRVFNVALEDTQIFTGYDLFADIGAGIADQRQYDVEVTDGELNIIFEASVNKPKISAIEIFGAAAIAAEEDGGEDEG